MADVEAENGLETEDDVKSEAVAVGEAEDVVETEGDGESECG